MVNTDPNAANHFFFIIALIDRDVEVCRGSHSSLQSPLQMHRSSAAGPTPLSCPTPTASPALTSSLYPPYPSLIYCVLALQLFWAGVLRRRLVVEGGSENTAEEKKCKITAYYPIQSPIQNLLLLHSVASSTINKLVQGHRECTFSACLLFSLPSNLSGNTC
jgi:hypothetical protein